MDWDEGSSSILWRLCGWGIVAAILNCLSLFLKNRDEDYRYFVWKVNAIVKCSCFYSITPAEKKVSKLVFMFPKEEEREEGEKGVRKFQGISCWVLLAPSRRWQFPSFFFALLRASAFELLILRIWYVFLSLTLGYGRSSSQLFYYSKFSIINCVVS